MNLTVHYSSGDLTMGSLQTAFSSLPEEHTGEAIVQGRGDVLACIVQEEQIACINGLDFVLSKIVIEAFVSAI